MDTDPSTRPAWLTTEFWLTVIPVILFLYKMLTGRDTSGIDIAGLATLAAGIAAAGYAISRAITKRAAIQSKAMIQDRKLAIAYDEEAQSNARKHELEIARLRNSFSSSGVVLVGGGSGGSGTPPHKTPAKKTTARRR